MTRVWSHRPQTMHLTYFFAAYVLGCGFAQALAIVPGITVSIWPPGGVFIATLILTSPYSWPWWILAGCLAEMFAQLVWFHSPLVAGFLIYVGNALCAAFGATLVNRIWGRPVRLESLGEVLAFVVAGAGVATLLSATVGSATLAWFGIKSQTFTSVWPLFWIGDATGILLVGPPTLVVIQHWRGKITLSAAQWLEATVLGLLFLGVAAFSLSADDLQSPYIILPPLLWLAVRFEFRGAAVALTLLVLTTMALTISGDSQFVGDADTQRQRQVALQLFLVISAFSALIVAGISRQNQLALLKVRQSEHQLQQLIDTVPAFIWCLTPEGVPSYMSRRAKDVTGVSLKDVVASDGSRSLAAVVHPDDLAAMDAALTRSIETGMPFLWKYRRREADGSHRWVESRAEPLRDESGEIVQWYGVAVDIEDVMRAQGALSDRQRELSQLVDMVPSHVWRLTPDGEPIFFNKRMVDFIGMDVADTDKPGMTRLAATIDAVVHQDDAAAFGETIRRCLVTGDMFAMRYRLRRSDGVYHWMSSRAEPLRDKDGCIAQWYGICHDINDQMHAEEAVRRSERDLRELVDVVPVAIACLAPDGEPTFFNKGMTDLLGLDIDDLGEPGGTSRQAAVIAAAVHPDDAPEFTEAFNHSLVTGEPLFRKYRLRQASGEYRWVDNRIEPLRNQDGAVLQWYGVCIDIDEEVRLYSALEEREAKIQRLVNSDIIGIVIWDLDGRLIDANDAFLRMVQYDREELNAGIDWLAMTPPEWREVHAREEAAELASTGVMQPREKEYFRKDGSRVPVLIGAACFEGQSRQGVAYILDLTERKRAEAAQMRAEEALRQASDELSKATRAASLAELSASIAHEVNQPLAAIVANSHACHRWLSAEPPNVERAKITAERITRDANSAADVVTRIRAVFKQSTERRSPTALSGAIADALELMAEEAERRRVRIDTDIEGDLPLVLLDRVQVQQVLINLMRNAIEAMDSSADVRVLGLSVRRTGDVVQTAISDRGLGIEFPDRIFEPFFTTKQNGMGMGLAICRSIVEAHGGRLWAERNEPQGAKLLFTLPVEAKATQ